ncbi:hypothetical protein EVAR_15791_1 [Eumeta japonica]|uniref:Uncharacterized protein n=1 Tax=Eumeta variegata TaxID=151549 RepID=A0A4C1TZD8_EUMVA|nr:hypothetical protein EVAR_15791_1 [Eumeta japonica]
MDGDMIDSGYRCHRLVCSAWESRAQVTTAANGHSLLLRNHKCIANLLDKNRISKEEWCDDGRKSGVTEKELRQN